MSKKVVLLLVVILLSSIFVDTLAQTQKDKIKTTFLMNEEGKVILAKEESKQTPSKTISTNFSYDQTGSLVSVVSSDGNRVNFLYDKLGNLSKAKVNENTIDFKFLPQSNLLEVSLDTPDGKTENVVLEISTKKGSFTNLKQYVASAPEAVIALNKMVALVKHSKVNLFLHRPNKQN